MESSKACAYRVKIEDRKLSGILTGGTMVAWVTFLIHNADAAGFLWPGFTPGMLLLFGSGLAGLGMWGRQRNRQGTSIDGLYLESKRSGANSPRMTGYAKDKAEQEYKDFIGRYKGK